MEYKGYTIKTEWESPSDCTYRIYDGEKLMRTGRYFDHEYDAIEQAKLDIDYYPKKYTPENRPSYPWVKVEDGLPELYEDVLAVWKMNDGANQSIESSSYEYYHWFNREYDMIHRKNWHVTHWQYLPALPD